MRQQIEEAKRELRRSLAGQTDWFLPEGSRHFDPVSVVGTLAVVLITAFLRGFIDEATKSAENAGRETFRDLKQACATAIGNKPGDDEAQLAEAERAARHARELAQTMSPAQRTALIEQSEVALRRALDEIVPAPRAAVIVTEVRTTVVTRVLALDDARRDCA